jgi:hypothetical protein
MKASVFPPPKAVWKAPEVVGKLEEPGNTSHVHFSERIECNLEALVTAGPAEKCGIQECASRRVQHGNESICTAS